MKSGGCVSCVKINLARGSEKRGSLSKTKKKEGQLLSTADALEVRQKAQKSLW